MSATPAILPPPTGAGPFVERLRAVHLSMVDAVLAGDGLPRVAAIAAEALGGAVVLVLPALQVAAAAPHRGDPRVAAVRRYVADHAVQRPAEVPPGLVAEVPIVSGGRTLGAVVLLGPAPPQAPAADVLNLAALAAVTAVALETGPAEAAARARAAVIDDIRTGADISARELLARALGLGADLSDGAMALTARARNGRLHRVAAAVAEEFPDALSAMRGSRLYALLPARRHRDAAAATTAAALRLADRMEHDADVGLSRFAADPVSLHRLVREAEIAAALRRAEAVDARGALDGTWRLLIAVAAAAPEELDALHAGTLAPVLEHDGHLGTELVGTLATYLRSDCNMNTTAAAGHLHRHTVAYRLDRLHELSGLDPRRPEDRERLGLALKAHRVAVAARER
jgi:PucR family transcriptional regulator, purine catabolism regulatory protein